MNCATLLKVVDIGINEKGGTACDGDQIKYIFNGVWDYPGIDTLSSFI